MEQVLDLHRQGLSPWRIAQSLGLGQRKIKKILAAHSFIPNRERAPKRQGDFCCAECGLEGKQHFYITRPYICRTCYRIQENKRQQRFKQELVDYKGGKCVKCGYAKCLVSLHFHHLDPSCKDPDWRNLRRLKPSVAKAELDKCILVCANCHGEIHNEEGEVEDGEDWYDEEDRAECT